MSPDARRNGNRVLRTVQAAAKTKAQLKRRELTQTCERSAATATAAAAAATVRRCCCHAERNGGHGAATDCPSLDETWGWQRISITATFHSRIHALTMGLCICGGSLFKMIDELCDVLIVREQCRIFYVSQAVIMALFIPNKQQPYNENLTCCQQL